jgi:hypothetical protein
MSRGKGDAGQPSVRVLFIVGYPRSGTTLLGMLLNEIPGFFFGGELGFFWQAYLKRSTCGCGSPVQECETWSSVMRAWDTEPAPARKGLDAQPPDILENEVFRQAATLHQGLPSSRSQSWNLWRVKMLAAENAQIRVYSALVGQLYSAIHAATGATAIVDSSKSPIDAAVAGLAPGIEPYFIHMIRRPQGVVHSHWKKREHLTWLHRQRKPVLVYHALSWLETNIAVDIGLRGYMVGRSLRVAYEDLVSSPRTVLEKVSELVGESSDDFSFLCDNTAVLGKNHSVRGNRVRSSTGSLQIREDTAWVTGLTSFEQFLVKALTAPLARRYGLDPIF